MSTPSSRSTLRPASSASALLSAAALFCCATASASVVTAPKGVTTTQVRKPNGLSTYAYHRAVQLTLASELTDVPSGTVLRKVGFELTGSTDVNAAGTIKIYLQNTTDTSFTKSTTWSTTITGMTLVYDGPYVLQNNVLIMDQVLDTPFTYTGGGIYVATDYVGTAPFASQPATYLAEGSALVPGCASANSPSSAPTTLGTTAFRPNVRWIWNGAQGDVCAANADCLSGFCVDGRCCNTACGGGAADDCQACSVAAGAAVNGVCGNRTNGASCSDGSACTQTDTCQAGVCTGSNPVVCTALDQCHTAGTCDPSTGSCSNPSATNGTTCSDGNPCTLADTCQGGACAAGTPKTCAPSDECHVGVCDPGTGTCGQANAANGLACNGSCGYACMNGSCEPNNPVVCTPLDQCHVAGVCQAASGTCTNPSKPDTTTCDDQDKCTVGDVCTSGACAGVPKDCSQAPDECHGAGSCVPASGECAYPTVADGTACSAGAGSCVAGACVPHDLAQPADLTMVAADAGVSSDGGVVEDASVVATDLAERPMSSSGCTFGGRAPSSDMSLVGLALLAAALLGRRRAARRA